MENLLTTSSFIIVKTIDDLLPLHEKTIKLEKGIYSKYDTFEFEIDMDEETKGIKTNSCSVIMRCDYLEHIKYIRVDFWFDIETRKILNYELDEPCAFVDEGNWSIKKLEKYIADLKDEEFILKEAFFFLLFSFPTL